MPKITYNSAKNQTTVLGVPKGWDVKLNDLYGVVIIRGNVAIIPGGNYVSALTSMMPSSQTTRKATRARKSTIKTKSRSATNNPEVKEYMARVRSSRGKGSVGKAPQVVKDAQNRGKLATANLKDLMKYASSRVIIPTYNEEPMINDDGQKVIYTCRLRRDAAVYVRDNTVDLFRAESLIGLAVGFAQADIQSKIDRSYESRLKGGLTGPSKFHYRKFVYITKENVMDAMQGSGLNKYYRVRGMDISEFI